MTISSMMDIDEEIWRVYDEKKQVVLEASRLGDVEKTMSSAYDIWMYMNRFRNCDLRFYYDEDLHQAIQSLNKKKFESSTLLKPKKKYRIAFVISNFSDTGGASVPHRFILEHYQRNGVDFEQFVLVSNLSNKDDYKDTSSYKYLTDKVKLSGFEHLPVGMPWNEKANYIENWIRKNAIDFVVITPCPASLYAIASRPALVHAVLSQDCYTFTIGPGAGDYTFMVTTDQVFKYKFKAKDSENKIKVMMLPLHTTEFIDEAKPLDLSKFNIPDNAIVSATSNMWKVFFGDTESLLENIALLIRRHSNYHHVFIGTSRCSDNLDHFLNKNEDLRNNIHYIGPISNIYCVLKSIHFWINSFPTSGGSDIEAALVGIPSIELIANRNLNLHGAEFLRSHECDVISRDEFINLAERFIFDNTYRKELGEYLKHKISREFNKKRIIEDKIYGFFALQYEKMLNDVPELPGLGIDDSINYEKRIAIYSSFGQKNWSISERRIFLNDCMNNYPTRSFAWIKSIEDALSENDKVYFNEVVEKLEATKINDHRIHIMLALAYEDFGDIEPSLWHAKTSIHMAHYDFIPTRVAVSIYCRLTNEQEAFALMKEVGVDSILKNCSVGEWLEGQPIDVLPLYYNY